MDRFETIGEASSHAIYIDELDNVFVGGMANPASNNKKTSFLLRRSTNKGVSWKNIDIKSNANFAFTSKINSISGCLSNKICLAITDSDSVFQAPSGKVRILQFP